MVSDEMIIEALITTASRKAAAEKCGISDRQLRKRLSRDALRSKYDAARRSLVVDALAYMQGRMCAAAETLSDVMCDEDAPAQTRVNAATSLISSATRLASDVDLSQRLDAIEEALNGRR